jgi:hypothetical protein
VAQRFSGESSVPRSVYMAFARLLYGPDVTGPPVEIAAELLELLDFRRRTGGGVDVASHPGNRWVFTALRQASARLAETTGLLPPSEAVVVVPDIERVTTVDLIAIRRSGAFENWRNQLAAGRAVYEESLSTGTTVKEAEDEFRAEMHRAAAKVKGELDRLSRRSLVIRGATHVGLGASGALAMLIWGWDEVLKALVGAVVNEGVHAVVDVGDLRRRADDLRAHGRHFDTFVVGQ